MKISKYMLVAVLCLILGTGLLWPVSGSCQGEKSAAGQQTGQSSGGKNTLQPPANADTRQGQKAGQADDPGKAAEPAPPKKARGAFNPTEGC